MDQRWKKRKGSDIKMLEQMLWQLGISPQQGYFRAGREGARIDSNRSSAIKTASCVDNVNDKRNIFLKYASIDGCVSTELMVKRFNVRNQQESGTILTKDVNATSGAVGSESLVWLQRDWFSYLTSVQDLTSEIIGQTDTRFDEWIKESVKIWDQGIGSYVPATLTQEKYNEILTIIGPSVSKTTEGLLRVWIAGESKYHWGNNLASYQQTDFRMTEGADESGSLSFSQLKYQYRYGKKPCAAHKDAELNLYHPQDNLSSMVIHTASSSSSPAGTANCEGGFHKAFVDDELRLKYNHNIGSSGETLTELIGFKHGNGAVTPITDSSTEDMYENLAKAIAIYNANGIKGQPFFTAQSWPRLLRYKKKDTSKQANTATICHSCKYSLEIRNKAETLSGTSKNVYMVW